MVIIIILHAFIGNSEMIYSVTFDDTGRVEDIDLDREVRAGDRISLSIDGLDGIYIVMTVSGPIYENVCMPANIRVQKYWKQ